MPYHVPLIHKVAAIGLRRTFLQFNHAHCALSAVAVGVKAAAGGVAEINSLVVPHIFLSLIHIFTKEEPRSVQLGLGIPEHDTEGRVITLEFDAFYLVTVYTPNAQEG